MRTCGRASVRVCVCVRACVCVCVCCSFFPLTVSMRDQAHKITYFEIFFYMLACIESETLSMTPHDILYTNWKRFSKDTMKYLKSRERVNAYLPLAAIGLPV